MKFDSSKLRATLLLITACAVTLSAASAGDKKTQAKTTVAQTVDSGSFGIFVKGERVATETFDIQQHISSSLIKAQLKTEAPCTVSDECPSS